MQVIPRDWQSKIELHIVTMNEAFSRANTHSDYPEKELGYVMTCHDFMEHLDEVFGGAEDFDKFLQSDLKFALADRGYAPTLRSVWDELPKTYGGTASEAAMIAETFRTLYKPEKESIARLPIQKHTPALAF